MMAETSNVRCSVAIPTYNRADMIGTTLESVLAQSLPGLEILVIDDQSTDNVVEVASSYRDPRLTVIRNERNLGLFGNFNECLRRSSGAYVRILCNDDRLTADCLAREVEVMEKNPGVALVVSQGELVDTSGTSRGIVGNYLHPGIYTRDEAVPTILSFLAQTGINPITLPSGVLLRKSACQAAGLFDLAMLVDGDLDYFLRLLAHGDLAIIDAVGCRILSHAEQVSSKNEDNASAVAEHFSVVARQKEVLDRNGLLQRINEQLAAFIFLRAVWFSVRGNRKAAAAHRALYASHRLPLWKLIAGTARCVYARATRKQHSLHPVPHPA